MTYQACVCLCAFVALPFVHAPLVALRELLGVLMAVVLVVSSSAVEHLAVERMSSKLVATWTVLETALAKEHGLVQDSTYVHGLVGILGTLGTGLVMLVRESFALVMFALDSFASEYGLLDRMSGTARTIYIYKTVSSPMLLYYHMTLVLTCDIH